MQSINNLFNWFFHKEPPIDPRPEWIRILHAWESEGDTAQEKTYVISYMGDNFGFHGIEATTRQPLVWSLTKLTGIQRIFSGLTSIPPEIGRLTNLTMLRLLGNQLTSIPTEIGCLISLQTLNLCKNQLKSLPIEIGNCRSLEDLDVQNNPDLHEFPLSLGQIPGLTQLYTYNSGISEEMADSILEQCQALRSEDGAAQLPSRLNTWKTMAKSALTLNLNDFSRAQHIDLNEWLMRLEKTRDFYRSQTRLAAIVCRMLQTVCDNEEFKELFFVQVGANNACCEDRAAMSLNEIYTSWKSGAEDLKIMTGVAKTLALRKELAKRIPAGERESVEIYLYYETLFKEHLCTAIEEMAYGEIGKRDWIDEENLFKAVNETFFDHLMQLPVFEKLVEVKLKSEWERIVNMAQDCPEGDELSEAVLKWQVEVMHERKRLWFECVKRWYDHAVNQ